LESIRIDVTGRRTMKLKNGSGGMMAQCGVMAIVAAGILLAGTQAFAAGDGKLAANTTRHAASDLEIGGELAGAPEGSTRYVTLDSLLALPLQTSVVNDDPDFAKGTKISGIALDDLRHMLAAASSDMVVAICDDKYRANYPQEYIAGHHPLLVLRVNGEPPSRWPKDPQTHKYDMGPYMISHAKFTPAFRVLSHSDEAQIPWGVIRLEFRNEKTVVGAIAPRGPHAKDEAVQQGYRIAQQNCYRCHNAGAEGGQKSGRPWLVLGAWAVSSPDYFDDYVRDPKKRNEHAEMPANRGYDQATVEALRKYFATFLSNSSTGASSAPTGIPGDRS
jgi:mono/diheme cytochrome c family protein